MLKKLFTSLKKLWVSRYGHIRFRLYDINCLGYLSLIAFLLFFFHRAVNLWPVYILVYLVLIAVILEIVRLGERYPERKIYWMLRSFYPLALIIFLWKELNSLTLMFFNSHWTTNLLVRLDKIIFGTHPTIWTQQFYRPWLNEFMHFFYNGYYLLFLIIPLSLIIAGKRREIHAVISFITFLYLSNFLLFFLFPALGPNNVPLLVSLEIGQPSGYFFSKINRLMQAHWGISGGAFPASHVAGAFMWIFTALRYNRKLGYFLIPIPVGIAAASVYLGLHHFLDSLSGIFWAVFCAVFTLKWLKKRGEDPLSSS